MSKHITGHTGLLCLLGSPVAHSVSPEMHNEACDQLGLDYSYLAFDVPEDKMPQAVEGLRTMGARGWNITMPGKNIMCKLADKFSPASEISGACNTIVNDNGVLTAYTTDGVGFMRAVAENGVDIIQMVAPTSEDRIRSNVKNATGFVYVVSSMGVTGMRGSIQTDLKDIIQVIKETTDTPVAIGFGIHTPKQAKEMAALADGVITGSGVVDIINKEGNKADQDLMDYIEGLKKAIG